MGIAERREKERNARIELIRGSAKRLFSEKGFENTSMEEIAREAEIAKGTIYLYFRSKEELVYSFLEPMLQNYNEDLRQIVHGQSAPAEVRLRQLMAYIHDQYVREPELYRLIIRYKAREFQSLLSEERFDRLRNLMSSNLALMEEVIVEGIEEGAFLPVEAKRASVLVWTVCMGIIQFEENRILNGNMSHLAPNFSLGTEIVLRGLKAR